MAGRLQGMITPQMAAAMRPAQARRKCVELSAQLASLAAGMEELEEENARWLMAMRRAASMARVSGLPGFSTAGVPPFGQEQACRWLLRLVEKGLGAIADAGAYRHMLFGRRSEKARRPGAGTGKVSVNDNPTGRASLPEYHQWCPMGCLPWGGLGAAARGNSEDGRRPAAVPAA